MAKQIIIQHAVTKGLYPNTKMKDSKVIERNGTYRLLNEVGYVMVDDYEIENPKIIAVRKFKTEDHVQEAKDIIRNKLKRFVETNFLVGPLHCDSLVDRK